MTEPITAPRATFDRSVASSAEVRTPPPGPSRNVAAAIPLPRTRGRRRLTRPPARFVSLTGDVTGLLVSVLITGYWTLGAVPLVVLTLVAFAIVGAYRSRLAISALDDLPKLAVGTTMAFAGSVAVLVLSGREIHAERAVLAAATAFVAIVALRLASGATIRHLRRRGVAHRTLILGAGRVGTRVARALTDHAEYGLRPVGFIDSNPLDNALPLPLLGSEHQLARVLLEQEIGVVVVAFAQLSGEQTVDVLRTCDRLDMEIFVVPRLFEMHHVSSDMELTWDVPLVRLRRAPYRIPTWRLKRLFDVVASTAALVVLAPGMATIALLVRLEGGPGVLFKQERVGVDGRCFRLLKFRSLRPVDESESATMWNIANDDRLGRVGKFLRRTSLDELPQLLNIIRGDMSIVGPRPERPHFVLEFGRLYPRYDARHRVPCGLTGWAQINGLRGNTSIEERARFDNFYIENWSLWLDVTIILRTLKSVLRAAGG